MRNRVTLKLANMRKPQAFIVYPRPTNVDDSYNFMTIQSDSRIAKFDATTGEGIISDGHQGGAYFHHLSNLYKTFPIKLTPEQLAEIKGEQWRKGDVMEGNGMRILIA